MNTEGESIVLDTIVEKIAIFEANVHGDVCQCTEKKDPAWILRVSEPNCQNNIVGGQEIVKCFNNFVRDCSLIAKCASTINKAFIYYL